MIYEVKCVDGHRFFEHSNDAHRFAIPYAEAGRVVHVIPHPTPEGMAGWCDMLNRLGTVLISINNGNPGEYDLTTVATYTPRRKF